MRPILKWAGGKAGPLSQLVDYFPKAYKRYVEPFVGGGAVFLSLPRSVRALINDTNPELIDLYCVVRDEPLRLMRELDRLAKLYNEDFYYKLRERAPKDRVKRAARTVFLNKCGFNGLYRLNSGGGFNVPFGQRTQCPALYDRENILSVSRRLVQCRILNRDFEQVIDRTGRGDFVYCDPPYAPLSRTSNFSSYTAGGFSHADQERLRDACVRASRRGARVLVSNSNARSILKLYADWEVVSIRARRNINSKGKRRGPIREILAVSH